MKEQMGEETERADPRPITCYYFPAVIMRLRHLSCLKQHFCSSDIT